MTWIENELFQAIVQVAVFLAALATILMAWDRYRERITATFRRLPSWVTHLLVAVAVALMVITLMSANVRRGENVSAEVTGLLPAINDNSERLTALETSMADLANSVRRVSDGVGQADTLVEPEPEPEARNRTFDRGETNDHCAAPRDLNWRIDASTGWEIVPDSITVNVVAQSSDSVYRDYVVDSSGGSFTVRGRLVNNGDCIQLFGETVARDGRGTLRVSGSYQERRVSP